MLDQLEELVAVLEVEREVGGEDGALDEAHHALVLLRRQRRQDLVACTLAYYVLSQVESSRVLSTLCRQRITDGEDEDEDEEVEEGAHPSCGGS